jgi:hypothetical protein
MEENPELLDPSVPVHLTKAGVLKDGEPDRSWFEESCKRSERAIAFAMAERDRELTALAEGRDYDGTA